MADSDILSVRLPPALKAKLDKVATALDRPRNWVAEEQDVEAAFARFRRRRRAG